MAIDAHAQLHSLGLAQLVQAQHEILTCRDDMQALLDCMSRYATLLTGADGAGVLFPHDGALVYQVVSGDRRAHLGLRLPLEGSLTGQSFHRLETLYAADVCTDPRTDKPTADVTRAASLVCVPLLHDGQAIGVLTVTSARPYAFSTEAVDLLGLLGSFCGTALTLARSQQAREAALAAAREERALLHMLMDAAPDLIFFKDTASRYTRINRAQAEAFGLADPLDAIGRTDFDFFPPEVARRFRAREQEIMAAEMPQVNLLEDVSSLVGQERWHRTNKAPLVRDGQVVGLVGIAHNVTPIHQSQEALRRSEERLRLVMSRAPVILFSLDAAGQVTFMEGGALDTIGAGAGILGVPGPLETTSNDLGASLYARRALAGESVQGTMTVAARTFEGWWTPLRDGQGAITGVLGVAVDITERAQAQAEAERLAQLRSEFVGLTSHELRTPLTTIVGYAELLLARWAVLSEEVRRDKVDIIAQAANRLTRLVEDLLLLSRLDTLALTVHCRPTKVEPLVHQVSAMVCGNYAGQRVECAGPPDLAVLADPDRLSQVLLNLLDNAAKYSPEGCPATLTWCVEGELAVMRVIDQGGGVSPEGREQLFTRFGRVAGSRIRAGRVGTGLGLYLSKALTEAMGGELDLEATGLEGSTFRVRLPLALC